MASAHSENDGTSGNSQSKQDDTPAEQSPTSSAREDTDGEGSPGPNVFIEKLYRIWEIAQGALDPDTQESSSASGETEKEKMTRFTEWLVSMGFAKSDPITLPLILPPQTDEDENIHLHRIPYQKLESPSSIRLLKLLPLSKIDSEIDLRKPIFCSIETVDLDENPAYDALSYTWGNPLTFSSDPANMSSAKSWSNLAFEITCDGKPVSVATNLYTALLSFRWLTSLAASEGSTDLAAQMQAAHITKTAYLWVDALCINQDDLAERSDQVAMMGRIYKQASSTYVWLGGEDDCYSNSWSAIDSLCRVDIRLADKFIAADISDESTYEEVGIPPISISSWIDLYAFFGRSWFKRAWIVQEVALARKVVVLIGLKIIPFVVLEQALIFLRRSRWVEQIRVLAEPCVEGNRSSYMYSTRSKKVESSIKLYCAGPTPLFDHGALSKITNTRAGFGIVDHGHKLKEGARPLLLSKVLDEQRFTQATDPRDKVYAFIGISQEAAEKQPIDGGVQLIPDYRKSVREVYSEATFFMIASWKSPKVLSLVQDHSETKVEDLPSWVPDFSADGWPHAIDDGRPTPWTATMGLGQFQLLAPNNYHLPVSGVKVGTIRGSLELDLEDPFSMFSFLLYLPGTSKINKPEMNGKLRQYLLEADVEDWLPGRSLLPITEDKLGLETLQTRYEVLWRTLLVDCFSGRHPAPQECGRGFDFFLQRTMHKMQWDSLQHFLEGDDTKWDAAKGKIRFAYTIWQTLKGLSYSVTRTSWPPEFRRAVKALEKTLPNRDPVTVTEIFMALREEMQGLRDGEEVSHTEEVLMKMRHVNTRRKLLRTDQAELGLGPFSMQNGDEIWLLVGADVPFVLRHVNEREYRLVGEAYVHGIMHGEAVDRSPATLNQSQLSLI